MKCQKEPWQWHSIWCLRCGDDDDKDDVWQWKLLCCVALFRSLLCTVLIRCHNMTDQYLENISNLYKSKTFWTPPKVQPDALQSDEGRWSPIYLLGSHLILSVAVCDNLELRRRLSIFLLPLIFHLCVSLIVFSSQDHTVTRVVSVYHSQSQLKLFRNGSIIVYIYVYNIIVMVLHTNLYYFGLKQLFD